MVLEREREAESRRRSRTAYQSARKRRQENSASDKINYSRSSTKTLPSMPKFSAMQSFLKRTIDTLSSSASQSSFPKYSSGSEFVIAPDHKSLFPVTDPAIDGEDCDKDCASCTIHLPAKFSIDESDKLYGHVKGWSTHLLVATGKTDWKRDVEDEKGSVMEAVGKAHKPSNGVSDILRVSRSR